MWTRRDWLRTTLGTAAAMPLAAAENAWGSQPPEVFRIRGVRIALQSASFSFSDLALPDILTTMQGMGLKELDIMSEHIEHLLGAPGIQLPGAGRPGPWARAATPAPQSGAPAVRQAPRGMAPEVREALRAWRLGVDLAQFRDVKARFDRAGLILFSYNLSFNDSYTDAEIERGLLMAKALGTRIITASSPLSVLPRVAPLAVKHDCVVAVHNHMEGPEYFAQAMALSTNVGVNLDVGHFFAMGHDPIAYLTTHLRRITNLHIKDRMSQRGAEKPFGEGETPLADVLRLVRDQKYDLPVCIEYVGPDGPAVEIKRCLDYCRTILET